MFCISWILHHHPSTVRCWTLGHYSALISTHAYIHKTFKILSIILRTQKKERKKEIKKEGKIGRKEERKKGGKRKRNAILMHAIYLWFLTLWRSEFSLAIIFSSAPRKSCWNAGSNFSLGLKKKMLLFGFHFWRTVSLGWQVFLLLLFPPLSASERCLWSVYNWTRTQLSLLSPSLSFSPSVTGL